MLENSKLEFWGENCGILWHRWGFRSVRSWRRGEIEIEFAEMDGDDDVVDSVDDVVDSVDDVANF